MPSFLKSLQRRFNRRKGGLLTPGPLPMPTRQAAAPANPNPAQGKRQSRPENFNPFAIGGLGIIPRRGISSTATTLTNESLLRMAKDGPLRLLSLLPEVHPSVSYALWNILRLACAPSDMKLIAVSDPEQDGEENADATGTAALNALWQSLPSEIGGLHGLTTSLVLQATLTGLVTVEAVPGPSSTGLRRVWPVDSLTIFFGRKQIDDDFLPYQCQRGAAFVMPSPGATGTGYTALNPDTFFWRAMDNDPDDPYGRAPFAPVIAEVLRDLALMQDINDAIHQAAWPRLKVGFNFAETFKIAKEVMGIADPQSAATWVQEQFNEVVKYVQTLKADDAIISDTNGESDKIEGGNFSGLSDVLVFLRHRIVQALKTLPTLMGINDGATQTYTSVEWAIYAAGLETLRSIALDPLLKVANLHLQLLGLPLVAIAKWKPIRTNDEKVDAETEALRIQNEITKRDQGWQTQDEASMKITGSAAIGEPIRTPAPGGIQPEPGKSGEENPQEQAAKAYKDELRAKYTARRLGAERGE